MFSDLLFINATYIYIQESVAKLMLLLQKIYSISIFELYL
jgi:hypothetical protein